MPNTLDELRPGEIGVIAEIVGADASLARRLAEMGLTAGEKVEGLAVAPWGDPLEIRLRGYRLSLRKREARCVKLASAVDPSDA